MRHGIVTQDFEVRSQTPLQLKFRQNSTTAQKLLDSVNTFRYITNTPTLILKLDFGFRDNVSD